MTDEPIATPFERKLQQVIQPLPTNPIHVLAYCHDLRQLLQARVTSLYKYCVICDANLEFFASGPGICDNVLCMYSHGNLKLWADASHICGNTTQHLCWTVAKDAVCSVQANICLEPRPVLLDDAGAPLALNADDNTALQAAIADVASATKALASPNPLCRSFARWALFAHRSHVSKIPELFGSQMTFQVRYHQ